MKWRGFVALVAVGEFETRPKAVAAILGAGATAKGGWLFGGHVEEIDPPAPPQAVEAVPGDCKRWERQEREERCISSASARYFNTSGELV